MEHKYTIPISLASLRLVSPALTLLFVVAVVAIGLFALLLPNLASCRRRMRLHRCCVGFQHRQQQGQQSSPPPPPQFAVFRAVPALVHAYNRDAGTVMRSVCFFIMMVLTQVGIAAVAEGSVSATHLAAFASAVASVTMFVCFFLFAGDLAMSFLIAVGWVFGAAFNLCYNTNPNIGAPFGGAAAAGGGADDEAARAYYLYASGGSGSGGDVLSSQRVYYWVVLALAFATFGHAVAWAFLTFRLWAALDLPAALRHIDRLLFGQRGLSSAPPLLRSLRASMQGLGRCDARTEGLSLGAIGGLAACGLLLVGAWSGRLGAQSGVSGHG